MEVIVIREPESGEVLAAIKNVGPETDWEKIDVALDGHLFSAAVPLYEDPTEFVEKSPLMRRAR